MSLRKVHAFRSWEAIVALIRENTDRDPFYVRIEALRFLAKHHDDLFGEALSKALSSDLGNLRAEARAYLADVDPEFDVELIHRLRDDPETPFLKRQKGLVTFPAFKSPKADIAVADMLDRMIDGKVAFEIQLGPTGPAATRRTFRVRRVIGRLETKHAGDGSMAQFQPCLGKGVTPHAVASSLPSGR